jgi:drug/metabolite transporter (DMT)-like permease
VAQRSSVRLWGSIAGALTGFAANSLLTRAAVRGHLSDAVTFSEIRLVSGALVLLAMSRWQRPEISTAIRPAGVDTWIGAAALAAYAFAFAFAYERIDASVGALALFGGVQITMLGWSIVSGERPAALEWIGLALALVGLAVLARPGRTAPDLPGALLMAAAGCAWGVYSLRGRGAGSALLRTASSFSWAAVAGVLAVALSTRIVLTPEGVLLATMSGAVASGLGYTLWYSALPSLSAFRAAVLQLMVPVLTAAAAVPLLGEHISLRFVTAAALILGGIGVAVARHPRVAVDRSQGAR